MAIGERIQTNPRVMLGKPVIRGTRIPVELILRKLAEGAREEDLLEAYPRLTGDDIRAAIAYAADVAHEENLPMATGGRLRRAADPCASWLMRAATSQSCALFA